MVFVAKTLWHERYRDSTVFPAYHFPGWCILNLSAWNWLKMYSHAHRRTHWMISNHANWLVKTHSENINWCGNFPFQSWSTSCTDTKLPGANICLAYMVQNTTGWAQSPRCWLFCPTGKVWCEILRNIINRNNAGRLRYPQQTVAS